MTRGGWSGDHAAFTAADMPALLAAAGIQVAPDADAMEDAARILNAALARAALPPLLRPADYQERAEAIAAAADRLAELLDDAGDMALQHALWREPEAAAAVAGVVRGLSALRERAREAVELWAPLRRPGRFADSLPRLVAFYAALAYRRLTEREPSRARQRDGDSAPAVRFVLAVSQKIRRLRPDLPAVERSMAERVIQEMRSGAE